jgi:hypothetical protein
MIDVETHSASADVILERQLSARKRRQLWCSACAGIFTECLEDLEISTSTATVSGNQRGGSSMQVTPCIERTLVAEPIAREK